jgi:hypothetical protein
MRMLDEGQPGKPFQLSQLQPEGLGSCFLKQLWLFHLFLTSKAIVDTEQLERSQLQLHHAVP